MLILSISSFQCVIPNSYQLFKTLMKFSQIDEESVNRIKVFKYFVLFFVPNSSVELAQLIHKI